MEIHETETKMASSGNPPLGTLSVVSVCFTSVREMYIVMVALDWFGSSQNALHCYVYRIWVLNNKVACES